MSVNHRGFPDERKWMSKVSPEKSLRLYASCPFAFTPVPPPLNVRDVCCLARRSPAAAALPFV